MGAQTLMLSRISIFASVSSRGDFKGLSFGTSIPHFLKLTSLNPLLANPTFLIGSCSVRSSRTLSLCALSPRKSDESLDDPGHQNTRPKRKKLAVFVSGGGSNFKAIHSATINGLVLGDVVVLVTNKGDCGGAAYAKENGIPVILFPNKELQQISPTDLVMTLRQFEVDFVLLAGYLKLIPVELVQHYPKRIVNIHPSLLPAFGGKGYYGLKVHKAVISSGARYSGPTVHYVDEEYDTGRILAQRIVPVCAFDTAEELAARVLHEEHQLYVDVVAALCEDRILWRDDGVPLIQHKNDPQQYS